MPISKNDINKTIFFIIISRKGTKKIYVKLKFSVCHPEGIFAIIGKYLAETA